MEQRVLSDKEKNFIELMANDYSIKDCVELVGVGKSTLYKWRNDEYIAALIEELKNKKLKAMAKNISDHFSKQVDKLLEEYNKLIYQDDNLTVKRQAIEKAFDLINATADGVKSDSKQKTAPVIKEFVKVAKASDSSNMSEKILKIIG